MGNVLATRLCRMDGCEKPNHIGGLCQMHHWRVKHHGDVNYVRPVKVCRVDNCSKRIKGDGLCQTHYNRKLRGTPLDFVARKLSKKRYKMVVVVGHPIAMKRGRVFVHRMNLFDQVNGSRLPCFWCGSPLEWGKNLFVDHLNHDKHDNSLTNLVPACNGCNAGRTIRNPTIRKSIYTAGNAT